MKIKSTLITALIILFSCGEKEEIIPESTPEPEPEKKIKFKNYRR